MISRAETKYIRISPQKAREIINLLKGKNATVALNLLTMINKKAAAHFQRVIKSAISNASQKGVDISGLHISKLIVNPGPILKRHRAAPFGRAVMIKKRTSHIEVTLDYIKPVVKSAKVVKQKVKK